VKHSHRVLIIIAVLFVLSLIFWSKVYAEPQFPIPRVGFNLEPAESPEEVVLSLQILIMLTILALVPSILIMMTSFTRTIIVLSFTRNALATQQMPPNQVLVGLALFITIFIMAPVFTQIQQEALIPYMDGSITQTEALDRGMLPLRDFMFRQTRDKDLALFIHYSRAPKPVTRADVPTSVLIPAFVISELKTAFQIGFVIFVPFIVIDMVVASTLMSMGMLMLPPVMISLPIKILLFILVDGWHLITRSLIIGF
jgi:flagellar biosynthetic protein FliP